MSQLARIAHPPAVGDLVDYAGHPGVVLLPVFGFDSTRCRVRFDADGNTEDVATADLQHYVVTGPEDIGKRARLLPSHPSSRARGTGATGVLEKSAEPGRGTVVLMFGEPGSRERYLCAGPAFPGTAVLVADRPVIATPAPQPAGVVELDAGARGFGIDLPAADLELVRETIHARGPRDDKHIDAIAHVAAAFVAGRRTPTDDANMRAVRERIVSLTVPSRPATDAVKRVAQRFDALPVDTTDERARTLFDVWAEAVNAGLTWDGQSASAQHGWRTLAAHLEQQP